MNREDRVRTEEERRIAKRVAKKKKNWKMIVIMAPHADGFGFC